MNKLPRWMERLSREASSEPTRAPRPVKHTKPTTLRATAIQQALAAETLRPEVTVIRTYNSDKEVVATYVKVRGTLGVLT